MRASAHGSMATVLLLLPLLAIPLFAIFGIPQFAPVESNPPDSAAPLRDRTAVNSSDAPAFSPAPAWGDAGFPAAVSNSESEWMGEAPVTDPAASVDTRVRTASATEQSPQFVADSPAASDAGGYRRLRGGSGNSNPQELSGVTTIAVRESPTMALTWKSAVERLNRLEIRNFRLEPGQQLGQFVFICSYTPQHSPRLSYRFEAQADEPLRAVEKVLEQIDNWMAAR